MESRIIKFRAWDTENERMIEPYFFEQSGYSDTGYRYYEDWRDLEDGRSCPCHVMQFTGLHDKNGVEIYEGDVLSSRTENDFIYEIFFEHGCFSAITPEQKRLGSSAVEAKYWCSYGIGEIIGNIFESPELVK